MYRFSDSGSCQGGAFEGPCFMSEGQKKMCSGKTLATVTKEVSADPGGTTQFNDRNFRLV